MLQLLDFSEPGTWIFISIFCCVVPVVGMTALLVFTLSRGRRLVGQLKEPNTEDLVKRYEKLRVKHPNKSQEQLIQQVVNRQSFWAGVVGALTSFGGVFVLPFTLPLDFYASMRIQNAMVYFIARVYGHQNLATMEKSAIDYMVMTGGASMAQQSKRVTGYIASRIALRVSEKAVAKVVPIIGAVVGFAVNYFMTQATGRSAVEYYSGNLQRRIGIGNLPPQLRD